MHSGEKLTCLKVALEEEEEEEVFDEINELPQVRVKKSKSKKILKKICIISYGRYKHSANINQIQNSASAHI